MPVGARSGMATTRSTAVLVRLRSPSRSPKQRARFFEAHEPVHALVAECDGQLIGIVHYLFHRSTTRLNHVCYLQDLFTAPEQRGRGVGRRLIQAVYEAAQSANSSRVYWTTHTTNEAGRALYDKVAKHLGFIVYSHELSGPLTAR
jgi:GNAT superfamily N-acetyltransferase